MTSQHQHADLTLSLKNKKRIFLLLLFFSCVINMLMLAPAIYMLQVYDRVLASQNTTTLLMLTLLVVGIYILISLLESVRTRVMTRLGNQLEVSLNARVLTAAFKRKQNTGEHNPAQALAELSQVRQFISGNGLFAFFDVPWIPVYLVITFIIAPLLGYLTAGGILLLFLLTLITEMSTKKSISIANALSVNNNSKINQQLQNAEAITAMGMFDTLQKRWTAEQNKVLVLQTKAADTINGLSSVGRFLRIVLQSVALGAGALLVIAGDISPGLMIASSIILGRALNPVEQLISSWKQFVQFRYSWQQLNKLLNEYPQASSGIELPKPAGNLSVEGLFAAAPGHTTPILKNISFQLAKGEVLGLIGPSASGKTTLGKLLVGVWGALSGKVRLDGADIYSWNKTLLGPSIGYLPQDVELFDGTIAENIARFEELDSEAIVAAAQLAGVHEMILRLPQGYETELGPHGYQLSGGQKQRIALARAVYKEPAFVLLDEPNANLDDAGEVALANTVHTLKLKGITTVIVSHRPALLSAADKILLLKDGAMQEFGLREEVFAKLRKNRILTSVDTKPVEPNEKVITTVDNVSTPIPNIN